MSMTVSSDPENQEHYSVHLLMGTKRGKKWLVKFSSSAFFFFFFYTQAGPPEDIIHCMCVWEGGEQGK